MWWKRSRLLSLIKSRPISSYTPIYRKIAFSRSDLIKKIHLHIDMKKTISPAITNQISAIIILLIPSSFEKLHFWVNILLKNKKCDIDFVVYISLPSRFKSQLMLFLTLISPIPLIETFKSKIVEKYWLSLSYPLKSPWMLSSNNPIQYDLLDVPVSEYCIFER